MIDMVDTVMNDSEASKYVHGVAFHWYDEWGLNYDYLDQVNQKYPNLKLLATEATNLRPLSENIRSYIWTYGQKYATDILRDMNHMTCGWIDWNMLLDIRGGPSSQHIGQNTKLNDLGNCDSPIRLNGTIYPVIDDDKYQNGDMNLFYQPSYWFYGHFARFISRGSFKISSSQEPPPSNTG
jgi:glucosylceramidase